MYERLEAAGELTGLPINSIVVVACLEWLDAHPPETSETIVGPFGSLRQMRDWPKNLLPLGARVRTFPFDRFSVRAKQALSMAQEQAEKHGQGKMEPEHLLLGLLRIQTGFAATILPRLGIDTTMVEARMESPGDKPVQTLVPGTRIKAVITSAFGLASEWRHRCVGTGHLLTALVPQADGVVAAVFKEKGVTMDTMTAAMRDLQATVGPED